MTTAEQKQGFNVNKLMRFGREVRAELRRVTWPTAADTRRMTLMVFVLVTIIAIFLLTVDMLIGWGLSAFLGLGA
jgi:preprotein translocase subunit SecE